MRFLAEPMGTRRQDTILITDLRVEKTQHFGGGRDISVFFDLYNMFNAQPGAEPAVELGHRVEPSAEHRPAAAGEDRREVEFLRDVAGSRQL